MEQGNNDFKLAFGVMGLLVFLAFLATVFG